MRTAAIAAFVLSIWTMELSAHETPPPYIADPEVYKLVADGPSLMNLLKPGQRDKFHSHTATAAYYLTDCNVRVHAPDGKFMERTIKAGTASVGGAVASHSVENIGQTECRVIVTEPK